MPIQKKTPFLILDIDHTLIHCMLYKDIHEGDDINNAIVGHKEVVHKYEENCELQEDTFCIFIRPGLFEFLDWCNRNFKIIIYSAGLPVYIDMILDYFKSILPHLVIHDIYSRNDMVPYQLNNEIVFIKSIMAIPYLAGLGKNYVILDDIDYHYPYSQEKRILISAWEYHMADDNKLELVAEVLSAIINVD